jgi:transglutaminase-like putative cysteine protease
LLLEIIHRTTYRYDASVFLLPHVLRLRPSTDASHRLLSFGLQIEPEPSGRSANIDLDGTDSVLTWFEPVTDHLSIEASSTVETLRSNPFDFLWLGEHSLPIRYPADLTPALQPYTGKEVPLRIRELAQSVAEEMGQDASAVLPALTNRIHATCTQIRRDEGDPWSAEETLIRQEGSCRDLTVLFMSAARSLGFAARFVSGYLAVQGDSGYDLHAWPEVYIPGGGWRAYDPSTGLAVAELHIACARAASPRHAAPVSGSYHGRAVSTLETRLNITRLD